MRTLFVATLCVLIQLASTLLAYSARAENHSATAVYLSRSLVMGMVVGLDSELNKGNAFPSHTESCIRSIDGAALAQLYESLIRERLEADSIDFVDSISGSELGERNLKDGINALRKANGLSIVDPVAFSDDELKTIDKFNSLLAPLSNDPAAANAIAEAAKKLMQSCL